MTSFILTILGVLYVAGAWKFWSGFRQTNFTGARLLLSILWGPCYVINGRYRKNFSRALKGR